MIVRIVKMTFEKGTEESFLEIFHANSSKIASFPGCSFLQLIRDVNDPRTFLTISHWDAESSLHAYRDSELFRTVWAKTSAMFAEKPQAWSTKIVIGH